MNSLKYCALSAENLYSKFAEVFLVSEKMLNVIHTLGPGWQMMDPFGLWSTYINEIFWISFFLKGSFNGQVIFLISSFFGHQGIHIWT